MSDRQEEVEGAWCCLCDAPIEATDVSPVEITLTTNNRKQRQTMWAHAQCLRESDLHEDVFMGN